MPCSASNGWCCLTSVTIILRDFISFRAVTLSSCLSLRICLLIVCLSTYIASSMRARTLSFFLFHYYVYWGQHWLAKHTGFMCTNQQNFRFTLHRASFAQSKVSFCPLLSLLCSPRLSQSLGWRLVHCRCPVNIHGESEPLTTSVETPRRSAPWSFMWVTPTLPRVGPGPGAVLCEQSAA